MQSLPIIDLVATGKNIMKIRESKGLSVKDIQEHFGFSTPQTIYKWQYGKSLPTVDNLVILSVLFDVSIEDILIVNS